MQLHHPIEICIEEAQVYLGEEGWCWLACCSLFVHYLSRTSLQLYQLLCNGQNLPLIKKLTYTITPSYRNMYWGSTSILGRGGLVLVGLLQHLVVLFNQNFKLELYQLLCDGQNFPLIGKLTYTSTPTFRSVNLGRTCILGRGVLVLVGLLQPLFLLFVHNLFTRTVSITM
jgi:hypothetical protein